MDIKICIKIAIPVYRMLTTENNMAYKKIDPLMRKCNEMMYSLTPVSYTHLDVYKRQQLYETSIV